jgi:hypothetical protein
MGFSAKQLQALRRQPNRSHIRTREAHGRELTYLDGWYAISRPTESSALMAGAGRPWNPAVY